MQKLGSVQGHGCLHYIIYMYNVYTAHDRKLTKIYQLYL